MKIYLQDLRKYNQGCSLCGKWINLKEIDEEDLEKIFKKLINDEFIILDWEYEDKKEKILFEDLENEFADPFELLIRQKLIDELTEEDKNKILFLIEYGSFDFNEAYNRKEEVYYVEGDLQKVAENFLEEQLGKETFDEMYPYINFEKYIRDMEIEGFVEFDNKVYYPF